MRVLRRLAPLALLLVVLVPGAARAAAGEDDRYSLAGGCYELRAQGVPAGPYRLQATDLGVYLLYDRNRQFLVADRGTEAQPSPRAEWQVSGRHGAFTLKNLSTGDTLPGAAFTRAQDCPEYPELATNTTGEPRPAGLEYGQTRGLLDTHLHGMAFEFLGGSIHCGRPWHRYGPAFALTDCPEHEGNGAGAIVENVASYGMPVAQHDTDGWPTFRGWPNHRSLTHEQVYWKWLERAWRGGLRMYTNLFVDNGVLCEIYPVRRNSCNEMDNVRLQIRRLREMVDYIDAQSGGPGKGFLRIVTDPFQARRVINQGKLAVIPGIEVSRLFDCTETNDVPECDRATIDRQFEEMYAAGVRQIELLNKYDNALAGVAGDGGTTGVVTNSGNRYETGHYLGMQTCQGPDAEHVHDKPQATAPGEVDRDALVSATIQAFLGPSALPAYPPAPHCNVRGLKELGAYVIRKVIDRKGMIFDPDHLSVLARRQALDLVEAHRYPGVLSSHSWSTPEALPRIQRLGGMVTPSEKSAESWVKEWRAARAVRDPRFLYGSGWSTDQNGFASQPGPSGKNRVRYPFRALTGDVTLDRQRSGEKTFDLNVDGVAHYGMYPDIVEEVRVVGGPEAVGDLLRGPEHYLQMWERASGVRGPACRSDREHVTRRGIASVRVGADWETLLKAAGQPASRPGRVWRWCVRGDRNRRAEVVAVFTPRGRVGLVASSGEGHRISGVGRASRAARVPRSARPFGAGVRVRTTRGGRAFVYGVRKGRVRFVAVAAAEAVRTPQTLRSYLRRARL